MNELTDRLADDLDGAFEALVRTHQDRLYSLALRYSGNPFDAQEVTQDAFVRAYRALQRYEASRIRALELPGWLTTIVLNLCRNHEQFVARRPRTAAEPDPERPDTADDGPESTAEQRESTRRWARLVAALPARYRAAVLLRHVDGASYAEMSAILDRPKGTLKAQVSRGIALLRAAFEADERAVAGGMRHACEGVRADDGTLARPAATSPPGGRPKRSPTRSCTRLAPLRRAPTETSA